MIYFFDYNTSKNHIYFSSTTSNILIDSKDLLSSLTADGSGGSPAEWNSATGTSPSDYIYKQPISYGNIGYGGQHETPYDNGPWGGDNLYEFQRSIRAPHYSLWGNGFFDYDLDYPYGSTDHISEAVA